MIEAVRDTRFDNEIDFLLENACYSIQYLVRRDFLNTPVDAPEMEALQEKVLKQTNVQKKLAAQHEDGWLGHGLHGIDSMDCLLRGILDAGVEKENPAVQKAVHALITPDIADNSPKHKNSFLGGAALDAGGRGGNKAVAAQILTWVHYPEEHPLIKEQIEISLDHLLAVPVYRSIDDFSIQGKNERWYKPNARFPGANHIEMLGATESWRTAENLEYVKKAAKHGYELMRDVEKYITFKKPKEFGSGFVGPFNYNWQALTPLTEEGLLSIINNQYPYLFAFWLRSVTSIPDFMPRPTGTYETLAEVLKRGDVENLLPEKAYHAFRSVLGREPSLRKRNAKKCDITYALLRACYRKGDDC